MSQPRCPGKRLEAIGCKKIAETQLATIWRNWCSPELRFEVASAVKDAEDFNAGLVRQGAVENEMPGEAVYFPGVKILQLGMAEGAGAAEAGRARQLFACGFGLRCEAIRQIRTAYFVGIVIPLRAQIRTRGWRNDQFRHGSGGAYCEL